MHKNAARCVLSNLQLQMSLKLIEDIFEVACAREPGEIPITQIEATDFSVRIISKPGHRIKMIHRARVGGLSTRRQTSDQTLQNCSVVPAQPDANSVCAE